jgi:hypothetical protein
MFLLQWISTLVFQNQIYGSRLRDIPVSIQAVVKMFSKYITELGLQPNGELLRVIAVE